MAKKSLKIDRLVLPYCSDAEDDSTTYWSEMQGILLSAFREGKIRVIETDWERKVKNITLHSDGKIEILI